MGQCPDTIKRLIDRFDQQSDQVRSPDYNETQLRIDFVNPMFHELGWDIDNRQGFAERYREVVHEDRVKVAGQTKAPDQGKVYGSALQVAPGPSPAGGMDAATKLWPYGLGASVAALFVIGYWRRSGAAK